MSTGIERIKALKGIKSFLDQRYFTRLIADIAPEAEKAEVLRRISGLEEEDAFARLCALMGTARKLVRFEQKPLVPGTTPAADFYARFEPGSCFLGLLPDPAHSLRAIVEVKSTKRDQLGISGTRLKSLQQFAQEFNLPLLMAVRFTDQGERPYWVIKDITAPTTSSVTFNREELDKCMRSILLDDYCLALSPDTHFIRTWHRGDSSSWAYHSDYGRLVRYEIRSSGNSKVWIGLDATIASLVSEAFQGEVEEVREESGQTVVTTNVGWPVPALSDVVWRMHLSLKYSSDTQESDADLDRPQDLRLRKVAELIIDELSAQSLVYRWGEKEDFKAGWDDLEALANRFR